MCTPVVIDTAGVVNVPSFDSSCIIFKASETSTPVRILKSRAWNFEFCCSKLLCVAASHLKKQTQNIMQIYKMFHFKS